MKDSLDHLPASKQNDLAHIVAVLRDEFEQVTGFAKRKKKHSRIVKIILFGSHATGDWVKDPAHGYVSDYDILVLLNRSELVEDYKLWTTAEERIALRVRPPLSLLVHTLDEVNQALIQGQYFFADIKRDGIVLYQSDKRELAEAGTLTPAEYAALARKHYAQWFDSAGEFFDTFHDDVEKHRFKKAAFELHQATERLYACLVLVLTNYKPYTHNLTLLNALAIAQDARVAEVFPQDTKIHRRRFQLLKRAYVEARYSEHYEISEEELTWLAERVRHLQELTEQLCRERINALEQEDEA